jgi:peptidoglycan hydrolase-like protein with peptidoglycan-binding domain
MKSLSKNFRLSTTALAAAIMLVGSSPNFVAFAQTTPPPAAASVALTELTIRALQDALNKQGIAVKADGVLNDETRAAIRKYQSVHHLPVTGEPDKATLNKLGVVVAQGGAAAPADSAPPTAGQGQMQAGMMMNCPMMQGQMQEMMKMMQGMMAMMQMMQGKMQPEQMQPGQMAPQMQPGAK